MSGDSNDWDGAMTGNLKFLLLELRKGQGDAQFAQVAGGIEARIREDLGKGFQHRLHRGGRAGARLRGDC